MAISVKDIKEKDFSSQKHGYSIEEVDDFLDEIADQVSELIRENLALKNSLQQAQNAPAPEPVVIEKETAKPEFDDQGYFRNLENAMRESLINAQRIAEETRHHRGRGQRSGQRQGRGTVRSGRRGPLSRGIPRPGGGAGEGAEGQGISVRLIQGRRGPVAA